MNNNFKITGTSFSSRYKTQLIILHSSLHWTTSTHGVTWFCYPISFVLTIQQLQYIFINKRSIAQMTWFILSNNFNSWSNRIFCYAVSFVLNIQQLQYFFFNKRFSCLKWCRRSLQLVSLQDPAMWTNSLESHAWELPIRENYHDAFKDILKSF